MITLALNPSNPRTIQKESFEKLKKSLKEFPQMLDIRPIIYDESFVILGGNMRYRALEELEKEGFEIKDSWFKNVKDLTEEQKREFVIKDNVPFGDWDYDELANEWSDLPLDEWGLDTSGWKSDEVEEDEPPEVSQEEPISKLGEVYQLGRHRLMCGDSTKIEDVEKLMDGKKADMVFTDPPYGIDADKMTMGTGKQGFHRGNWDNSRIDITFLLGLADKVCIWGGNYYTDILPITNDWLCWHKKNDNLSFSEFELAWTNFGKNCRHISHHWGDEKKQHITMKPVGVMAWGIGLTDGKIVIDPFGGSGSTLIACEQLNRTCYMMELDPKYCDVIRKRYAKFIGKEDEWQTITPKI